MTTYKSVAYWWKLLDRPFFHYFLLAGITLLASVLRFYKLGQWSFWFDEIFTVNRALVHYSDIGEVFINLPQRVWLPLSLLFTGQTLTIFETTEWTARVIPALFGIITIPILYLPIKRYFGSWVALLSVLLLAFSPWHLFWSQNARFYTALLLFAMLALFSFFYAFERNRPAFIIIGYGLFYFAASERLIALMAYPSFLIFLVLVYFLPFENPPGYRRKNIILFLAPAFLFLVFELFQIITTGNSFLWDVIEVFGANRGPSPFRLVYRIILDLGVPITCLAAIGGLFQLSSRNRTGLFLISYAITPVLMLVVLNRFLFTDDRYAFLTLPAWIILAVVTIKEIAVRIKPTNYGAMFIIAIPILVLSVDFFTDMRYFQSNSGHRLDWKGAFSLVASRQQEGDVTASYWPELADYYLDKVTISLGTLRPNDVVESNQRHWFIIDDYAIWSAGNISQWVEKQCDLVMFDEIIIERPQLLRVFLCEPGRIALSE
jgi:uncharacterized membrane protein